MLRRLRLAALSAAILALAGCGGGTQTVTHTIKVAAPARAVVTTPPVCLLGLIGRGAMGACGPRGSKNTNPTATLGGPPRWEDLSNNDPCVCGAQLKAEGYVGLVAKANQGTGFLDSTEVPMIQSARAAGLAVGVYDFDQDYSIAEADALVRQAQAAGIFPNTPNTFPLTFDVEFGNFSYSGLLAQIAHVQKLGYRVNVYTGEWYWGPHAGCQWPAGITAWISGYPVASHVCGLPDSLWAIHQYSDTPVDLDILGSGSGGLFLANGTAAQLAAYVAGGPPPVNHHYSRYPRTRRKACGCSEHAVVIRYDKLRALQKPKRHPHAAELKRLRHDCKILADRIDRIAHRTTVGVWGTGPDWRFHRLERERGLRRRQHGGVVPRPRRAH